MLLDYFSGGTCLGLRLKVLYRCFPLAVSGIQALKSMINFEFMFVQCERYGLSLIP